MPPISSAAVTSPETSKLPSLLYTPEPRSEANVELPPAIRSPLLTTKEETASLTSLGLPSPREEQGEELAGKQRRPEEPVISLTLSLPSSKSEREDSLTAALRITVRSRRRNRASIGELPPATPPSPFARFEAYYKGRNYFPCLPWTAVAERRTGRGACRKTEKAGGAGDLLDVVVAVIQEREGRVRVEAP
nr:hypothetical protein Iba_chr12fCG12810 [Ipomoea batatas]